MKLEYISQVRPVFGFTAQAYFFLHRALCSVGWTRTIIDCYFKFQPMIHIIG